MTIPSIGPHIAAAVAHRATKGAALIALAAVCGGLLLSPARGAVTIDEKCLSDIQVASDDLDANIRKSTTELKNVEITGCDARILARRASTTSMDFDDSSWTLNGDVQILMQQPTGSLRSDKAVVVFKSNQVQRVTLTGNPVEFEQKRKDGSVMRGRARQMVYVLESGTVTLTEDAWLTDGGSTNVKASQVTYDVRTQDFAAGARTGERVIMRIKPGQKKDDDKRPASSGQGTTSGGTGNSAPPRTQ